MVATFKANNNNEDDIAESDTESVTLEMSKKLFPDQDELFEGASFEVDNFDIFEKDLHEAFVGWKLMCRKAELEVCRKTDLQKSRFAEKQNCKFADFSEKQIARFAEKQICRFVEKQICRKADWQIGSQFCRIADL